MENISFYDSEIFELDKKIEQLTKQNETHLYWLFASFALYFVLCIIFTKAVYLQEECKLYGLCTIIKVSDNPYRVYYKTDNFQNKIIFNPESSFYFGDNVIDENVKFQFVPWLLVFKTIKK